MNIIKRCIPKLHSWHSLFDIWTVFVFRLSYLNFFFLFFLQDLKKAKLISYRSISLKYPTSNAHHVCFKNCRGVSFLFCFFLSKAEARDRGVTRAYFKTRFRQCLYTSMLKKEKLKKRKKEKIRRKKKRNEQKKPLGYRSCAMLQVYCSRRRSYPQLYSCLISSTTGGPAISNTYM